MFKLFLYIYCNSLLYYFFFFIVQKYLNNIVVESLGPANIGKTTMFEITQKLLGFLTNSPNICSKCTIPALLSRFTGESGCFIAIDDVDRFLKVAQKPADELISVCYDTMGDWTITHGNRCIHGTVAFNSNKFVLLLNPYAPTEDSVLSRLVSFEWDSEPFDGELDMVEINSRFSTLSNVMNISCVCTCFLRIS